MDFIFLAQEVSTVDDFFFNLRLANIETGGQEMCCAPDK